MASDDDVTFRNIELTKDQLVSKMKNKSILCVASGMAALKYVNTMELASLAAVYTFNCRLIVYADDV